MSKEVGDIIDSIYDKTQIVSQNEEPVSFLRKSPKAKYKIFDEEEFTRGREVLGDLIVQGMVTSGGTDIDWMIEHNGCFIILEFKGVHDDKINITKGQMIAYERLYEKLNQSTRCFLYIIGYDEADFSNPDSKMWFFEMKQWNSGAIPKNTLENHLENKQNKFVVYRDYLEETSVEGLRKIIDFHWKQFE